MVFPTFANTSRLSLFLLPGLFLSAEAQAGNADALIDALNSINTPLANMTFESAVDDPQTGDAIIKKLKFSGQAGTLSMGEIRAHGVSYDGTGALSEIDRLQLKNTDLNPAGNDKFSIHDLTLEDLNIAQLQAFFETGGAPEEIFKLETGPAHAAGIAANSADFIGTIDDVRFDGIVDGRIGQLDVRRVMLSDFDSSSRLSLEQIDFSGVSLDENLLPIFEFLSDPQSSLDADEYRAAMRSSLPTSLKVTGTRLLAEDGSEVFANEMTYDARLEGSDILRSEINIGPVKFSGISAQALTGDYGALIPVPDGPVELEIKGNGTVNLSTFQNEASYSVNSDGYASLNIDFSGTALDLAELPVRGAPPSTLSGMKIDYVDMGLMDELLEPMAAAFGADRQGFAFQMMTFARMMFPNGASPEMTEALSAIESFLVDPGRLTITVSPPKPLSVDGLQDNVSLPEDPNEVMKELGLTIEASPVQAR